MKNKLTGNTKVFLFVQEDFTPADLELWGLARAFKSCEGRQGFSFVKSAMCRLLKDMGVRLLDCTLTPPHPQVLTLYNMFLI